MICKNNVYNSISWLLFISHLKAFGKFLEVATALIFKAAKGTFLPNLAVLENADLVALLDGS